jgi:hypothetical protein
VSDDINEKKKVAEVQKTVVAGWQDVEVSNRDTPNHRNLMKFEHLNF